MLFVITVSVAEPLPKVKNVEFLYDRGSSRRIGYVVTKVHPVGDNGDQNRRSSNVTIDHKQFNNDNESENGIENRNTAESNQAKEVDRTAFIDDGHGT